MLFFSGAPSRRLDPHPHFIYLIGIVVGYLWKFEGLFSFLNMLYRKLYNSINKLLIILGNKHNQIIS